MRPEITDALLGPIEGVGQTLLALDENQWFDRKSIRKQPRELANDVIGFANAEGGTIVVGLSDGRVEDLRSRPDHANELRQLAMDFTVPTVPADVRLVDCVDETGRPAQLLMLEVAASESVHANRRDEVYLRVGDETRRLSFQQRRELEFDKGQSNFELTPTRLIERSDLDRYLLEEFRDRLGSSDEERLLVARGLVQRHGQLTVGAALLFADYPQRELPESFVRVIRYRGVVRGAGRRQHIVEDHRVEGPILRQLRELPELIGDLVPKRRALTEQGVFSEVGAIPRDAWIEGVVNAVTHRSYAAMGDHIRIEIFEDRLEIHSPGRFPGIVDLSRPHEILRFARNPRVARVLSDLGFGQELGEGIRRIFEEMRLSGLSEPVYHQTSGGVILTLSAEPVDRALEERLSRGSRDLVRVIRELGRASTGEIVEAQGRSRPSVIKDLRILEEAGLIEWVGRSSKDPRAYWTLPRG